MVMRKTNSFYNLETIGGILLFASALLAIAVANSPLRLAYHDLLSIPVNISIGELMIKKPLLLWVNDVLMAM